MFEVFDSQPLAAASLGQVHYAQLKSGQQVVVKVQRPGLKQLFEIDLATLKASEAAHAGPHPRHTHSDLPTAAHLPLASATPCCTCLTPVLLTHSRAHSNARSAAVPQIRPLPRPFLRTSPSLSTSRTPPASSAPSPRSAP